MTSQPIRLSTNFMNLIPSLTFIDYEWFPWSICNGCGMPAGNAYPSGHLVPSPIVGLACVPIVETRFLELVMSLLDFSPRIPLGTFSIFLMGHWLEYREICQYELFERYSRPSLRGLLPLKDRGRNSVMNSFITSHVRNGSFNQKDI